MSAIKDVLEDMTTWTMLDWYADELHGNWAPVEQVTEAYAIRDWFQRDIEKRYNISTEGFIEMMKLHTSYEASMTDCELEEYQATWADDAARLHNYYRQALRLEVAA